MSKSSGNISRDKRQGPNNVKEIKIKLGSKPYGCGREWWFKQDEYEKWHNYSITWFRKMKYCSPRVPSLYVFCCSPRRFLIKNSPVTACLLRVERETKWRRLSWIRKKYLCSLFGNFPFGVRERMHKKTKKTRKDDLVVMTLVDWSPFSTWMWWSTDRIV